MFKWAVRWIIIKAFVVECPDPPKWDEFGRKLIQENPPSYVKAPCFVYDTTKNVKLFDRRDSAMAFLNRGNRLVEEYNRMDTGFILTTKTTSYYDGWLAGFKLDSIPVK